jgi:hypothetical protein
MRRLCALLIMLATFWPVAATAEEGGGGDSGGGEGDFNYDDGSGSVSVVDYNRGNQDIARAARDGRALTITGARGGVVGLRRGPVPEYHTVIRGDTLWDLSSHYYADPWYWPRVWSYNPEITNPNWIYPGDRIRMIASGAIVDDMPSRNPLAFSRGHRAGTLFLRNRGFVDHETLERAGTLVGSREEVELLVEHDEAYLEFPDNEDATVGREYTVFHIIDDDLPWRRARGYRGRRDLGVMVEVLGTVRVVSYDPDEHIARAVLTESIRPIERGHLVAPMRRQFDIIPPVQNEVDLEGRIVGGIDPMDLLGEGMIVFIDRGREDGVLEGNRVFVRRRRDMFRESEGDRDDRAGYPYEVIAELRIVEVRDRTSTCMVTRSIFDIHTGDEIEMRRGY